MKIAISSTGENLESAVDMRFGRASRFLVIDTETGDFEVADNTQNLNAMQGAGIQSAQNVAALGVQAVLTGHCGPKAFRALEAAGVRVFAGVSGTCAEALQQFQAGKLQEAGGADVQGHWM